MTTEQIMSQAQVFASAWALVGSRFDDGSAMDNANEQKAALQSAVEELVAENARLTAKAQHYQDEWSDVCNTNQVLINALKRAKPFVEGAEYDLETRHDTSQEYGHYEAYATARDIREQCDAALKETT